MILRFGAFELDLRAGELRRGGVLLKLSPQQFRVLRFLAERGGQVCTREEIRREIWGDDVFVDFERGLNVCIAAIRAALNDDSEAPRFIQTVPRQGYRFVAPVEQVTMPPVLPVRRRSPWIAVATVGLAIAAAAVSLLLPAHKTVLAVLPFENLTQRAEDAPMVDGLSDELLTQMGAVDPERLAVIGRTSVRRYRDGKASLAQLGADYIIEGGMRSESGVLRISVRLVKVASEAQVWSETFQEEGADRLELQETVAAKVLTAVEARLFPRSATATVRAYSPKAAARETLWNGRYLLAKDRPRAIVWFQQAADLDTGWAEPRASLAEAYLGQGDVEVVWPPSSSPKRAPRRRQRCSSTSAMPRRTTRWRKSASGTTGSFAGARRHYQRALAINPSMARAHHDYAFFQVCR